MKTEKKIKVSEIRKKLHKLGNELGGYVGSNKLVGQYGIKVLYMLRWMRLIHINKNTLKGWSMPDMRTISEFEKIGREKK